MATELRVATFNVRNGRAFDGLRSWPFRRATTAAAIAGLDAEVVALQEVYSCQRRALLRRLPRYDAVGAGRTGGTQGEACPVLLDPSAVRLDGHATRWFGPTPEVAGTRPDGARFPRIATIARLLVGADQVPVQVVSTHLDAHERSIRIAAAEQLATWLDPTVDRIVLGDLNADPGSPVIEPLLAVGLRDAVPSTEGGTEHAWTGRTDRRRIDHVLVSDRVEVVSARVEHPRPGGRLPSDHWPVVADLRLGERSAG